MGELTEIRLDLGPFQAGEVSYGMDIDADDGHPEWGRLEFGGRQDGQGRQRARLTVLATQAARDRALYRITSCRDIWQDNAGASPLSDRERAEYAAGARSLSALCRRLVKAAGGPEGFSPDVRRWIVY